MKIKRPLLLAYTIGISQLAGIVGSFFTVNSVRTWYVTLNKPFFNPPNWVFGPVWLTLYTLMGISLYLVLISKNKESKYTANIFYIHLIINSIWSIIFFGNQNLELAIYIIIILDLLIIYLIKLFRPINKLASNLLLPYLAWVTFASVLNFTIWILN